MRRRSLVLALVVASSLLVLAHAYENPVFIVLHSSLADDETETAVTAKQIFKRCDLDKDR